MKTMESHSDKQKTTLTGVKPNRKQHSQMPNSNKKCGINSWIKTPTQQKHNTV